MHRSSFLGTVLLVALVTACDRDTSQIVAPQPPRAAVGPMARTNEPIPNSYLVMFHRDSAPNPTAIERLIDVLNKRYGGHVSFRYDALGGFAVDSLPASLAQRLAAEPAVASVEANTVLHLQDVQYGPGAGLDRIDQDNLPLDNAFSYAYTGAGVNVYIIDTGVDSLNPEFRGRIGTGTSCVSQGGPWTSADNFGHGTAVASVAAGSTFGVAKGAIIHSVRISGDANGTSTDAIETCGINWVASYGQRPAVANMSFGGIPSSFAARDAINNVAYYGQITFVKAAGNDASDAYLDRTNRGAYEVVVGATDPTNDSFASFSDYGSTITTSAPGVNVLVADKFNPGYGKLGSGTSFAAPYVAGVVAAMLQAEPNLIPSQVVNQLEQWQVVNGVITGLPAGTPNRLLRNGGL